ncbi:STY0301 family protein [Legionella gresilensis]|uniref:STY0301 family protein n=1 Tax=Legionella gresilensis TaxID=91823 RepID=UPI001041B68B|nr:STY0301 family protein [Legionella gresilensis]
MKVLIRFIIFLISGILLSFKSLAHPINCPKVIKTTQPLKAQEAGWKVFLDVNQTNHLLGHVTFYAGHPSENASLAPDNENMKTNKMIWRLQGNNFWMACSYTGTTIKLIQQLPKKTKICSVNDEGVNFIKSISCD